MNLYTELVDTLIKKNNVKIGEFVLDDIKEYFDYEVEDDYEYHTNITKLVGFMKMKMPLGIVVALRDRPDLNSDKISMTIESKEIAARTRILRHQTCRSMTKKDILEDVDRELVMRMLNVAKQNGERKNAQKGKEYNFALVPERTCVDHPLSMSVIETKHLTDKIIFGYKGKSPFDQGIYFAPYKLFERPDGIFYRYGICDCLFGSQLFYTYENLNIEGLGYNSNPTVP